MVAYNCQKRFVMPILTRRKIGTIRGSARPRHARPGEVVQLYTGMRTRWCSLIAKPVCDRVDRLRVWFDDGRVVVGEIDDTIPVDEVNHVADVDAFAMGDGFDDWEDMARFWWDAFELRDFDMTWIRWLPETVVAP